MSTTVTRRDFARLFAFGGSAALLSEPAWGGTQAGSLAPGGVAAGEVFWKSVRAQFMMPPDLAVMNAANLCPASRPVGALARETANVDRDPSPNNRARLYPEKENTRAALAQFLRVTPEEIIITRNTSESNNLVSSGLDLKAGDEVIVHSDNHLSNLAAWREKETLRLLRGHGRTEESAPGRGVLPRRVFPGDHAANESHLLHASLEHRRRSFDAWRDLCRMARDRGVLTLVDGARASGLWTSTSPRCSRTSTPAARTSGCAAPASAVLFVNKAAQTRLWPTVYSAYPGAVGFSRTFEGFGQRDEATMIAFREALAFQEIAGHLRSRSGRASWLRSWSQASPSCRTSTSGRHRSSSGAAVVSLRPGSLDPSKLAAALYQQDKIAVATRGGQDRGGIRVSPHLYNSPAEVDRLLAALRKYLASGL